MALQKKVLVKGYIPSSYNEWAGKIVAIIFVGGCNFKCGFCHNKDLVVGNLPDISFKDILNRLIKRRKWIDAVEISGGEPSLHKSKIIRILRELKREGFLTMINTNGSDPSFISELKDLVDYWAMDIKAGFDKYEKVINSKVNIDNIKRSIKLIMNSKEYEFRTTVIPGLHSKDDILEIAKMIKGAKRYFIQNFVPQNTLDPSFMKVKPFPKEKMKEFAEKAKEYIKEVQIR